MFTGIVTHVGQVENITKSTNQDLLIAISVAKKGIKRSLEIGCSIACNGICLTLIEKKNLKEKFVFFFQASDETAAKTNIQNWQIGSLVNLEFALKVGDELGGHFVLCHVDGLAQIKDIKSIQDSRCYKFIPDKKLKKFISAKGSITINGVSLTINEVKKDFFAVNLIEHTNKNTSFKNSKIGDFVNIEIDVLARYLETLITKKND